MEIIHCVMGRRISNERLLRPWSLACLTQKIEYLKRLIKLELKLVSREWGSRARGLFGFCYLFLATTLSANKLRLFTGEENKIKMKNTPPWDEMLTD